MKCSFSLSEKYPTDLEERIYPRTEIIFRLPFAELYLRGGIFECHILKFKMMDLKICSSQIEFYKSKNSFHNDCCCIHLLKSESEND